MATIKMVQLVLPKTNSGHCRSCGALIDWYTTPRGKGLPMNANATPLRVTDGESTPTIGHFDASDTHWATCPFASTHRR